MNFNISLCISKTLVSTEMYFQLLTHAEVRWLLTRVFELKDEVRIFLLDTKYANCRTDSSRLCITAYIADVFEHFNVLNPGLQVNNNIDMVKSKDKVSATVVMALLQISPL